MTDLDPAVIMAAHTPWPRTTWCPVCTDLSHGGPYVRPPCLPHRLAEALQDAISEVDWLKSGGEYL